MRWPSNDRATASASAGRPRASSNRARSSRSGARSVPVVPHQVGKQGNRPEGEETVDGGGRVPAQQKHPRRHRPGRDPLSGIRGELLQALRDSGEPERVSMLGAPLTKPPKPGDAHAVQRDRERDQLRCARGIESCAQERIEDP